MNTDTRPIHYTIEQGILGGVWSRRWTELRREGGAVVCCATPGNYVKSIAPSQLLTEEQAGKELEKARKV